MNKRNLTAIACISIFSSASTFATLIGLWELDDPGTLGKATVGTDLSIAGTRTTYSASVAGGGAISLNTCWPYR